MFKVIAEVLHCIQKKDGLTFERVIDQGEFQTDNGEYFGIWRPRHIVDVEVGQNLWQRYPLVDHPVLLEHGYLVDALISPLSTAHILPIWNPGEQTTLHCNQLFAHVL